jgi:type I restriction enzyme S subunit
MKTRFSTDSLGNFVKVRTGKLDANANDPKGQYPFFTCAVEPLRINTHSFDCECVLVAGNGDLNVKYYEGKFDAYQRTYVIESLNKSRLDVRYLFHFMSGYVQKLRELSIGGVIKYIKLNNLTDAEIPLPSLDEQRRIAAILDKADAIRRKRQESISLTEEFLRSTFLEMFGDPVSNPKGWDRKEFGEIMFIDSPMVDPQSEQFLDLLHIGPDRIEKKTGKILPALTAREDRLISGKFLFDERHVLYSKIRPLLRKAALPNFKGLCSADMYPIRPNAKFTNREFLWSILLSDAFTDFTQTISSRANIPKINRTELASYKCITPPLELQNEYAKVLAKNTLIGTKLTNSTGYIDDLFAGLTHRAFSGEL